MKDIALPQLILDILSGENDKKEGLNVLSLFDGLGGGRLALDELNVPINSYFASEIDQYAMAVAKKNYENIIHIGNVVDVDGKDFKGIDLLIGGSPCQGFSFAGKQLNFNDPRSKLFFEFVRILDESKPTYFFLENVNMKKEFQDVISEMLGVQPITINSSSVAPQLRNRLYWTNIPFNEAPEPVHSKLSDIIESGYVNRDKSYCIDASYYKGGNLKSYFKSSRRQLVFLDEASFDKAVENYHKDIIQIKGLARMLSPVETERTQGLPDNYTLCPGVSKSQRYHMVGNGWTIPVVKHFFKFFSKG